MSTVITQAKDGHIPLEEPMTTPELPHSSIPVFSTLQALREWRKRAFDESKSVGFVPTMGALHEGHMSLVRRSLEQNDLTILSIFVNPAQFAPHEDLATYPRTLDADLALLSTISVAMPGVLETLRTPSAVFLPAIKDMYPSGVVQDVGKQKGTFVEVKGYSHQMEGQSRPTFFRGVATVVTKLFNAVQPTNAYFGQKDIQQALLLRRMARDLLLPNPTYDNVHIVPTHRCPDGLALSSRNAYLSEAERAAAPTLYTALREAETAWSQGSSVSECLAEAVGFVADAELDGSRKNVSMRLDYIQMNDPETFEVMDGDVRKESGRAVILSGALWVGRTRLIDNLLLGDTSRLLA
ncbi:pantothenate synthase [Tulasnella sp. 403]|nr:pantothenate synthase [Tulasnella sp. 403]